MRHLRTGRKSLVQFEIWVTYGPALDDRAAMDNVIRAGATGCRFNFSYGTPALQLQRAEAFREAATAAGREALLIADLPGEKIRLTTTPGGVALSLHEGDRVILDASDGASSHHESELRLGITHLGTLKYASPGDMLLLGDGSVELQVVKLEGDAVWTGVAVGGEIEEGRGVILRGRRSAPAALTAQDIMNLEIIARSRVFDMAALSFVAHRTDVERARQTLSAFGTEIPVVAKVETLLGVKAADEIADVADILIAGRGDLALTDEWVELPLHVRTIANAARSARKPWIVGTQIMEGLDRFALPTRAEICDLHRWIEEGATGALLSHETAFGKRPAAAVRCVSEIARRYVSESRYPHVRQTGSATAR